MSFELPTRKSEMAELRLSASEKAGSSLLFFYGSVIHGIPSCNMQQTFVHDAVDFCSQQYEQDHRRTKLSEEKCFSTTSSQHKIKKMLSQSKTF